MAFSGALTITDLNDFINPSQACIKPVEQLNKLESAPGAASTQIEIDSAGGYYEVTQGSSSKKKLETAQISLNDCLACSGCITSAESVLITLQSHAEVLSFLTTNPPPASPDHRVPVLSIAPQSLASLAASLSPSPSLSTLLSRLSYLLSQLGFFRTYDTTFARHISLKEQALEFAERVERRNRGEGGEGSDERLPMLASACPGWVCYAEKTHGEMLPFMSKVKSPQQVMGTLVKGWLGQKWGKTPDQIYHVTVMPCYDKKLEASRQDFYSDVYSTRDVDCVLTTGELALLLREKGLALSSPTSPEVAPVEDDIPLLVSHPGSSSGSYLHSLLHTLSSTSSTTPTLEIRPVRGSGDYVEYTLAASHLAEQSPPVPMLRAATCYGFRNLQNLVRKVARDAGVSVVRGAAGSRMPGGTARRRAKAGAAAGQGDASYDFVEVMACPGGCVNGGGQMKPDDVLESSVDEEGFVRDWSNEGVKVASGPAPNPGGDVSSRWGDKEWLRRTEEAYWSNETGLPTPPPSPSQALSQLPPWPTNSEHYKHSDILALKVLEELCQPAERNSIVAWSTKMDEAAESRRRQAFRTQYRAVESDVVGLAVKW